MSRSVTLRIRRTAGWTDYTVRVPDEAYVLDALESAGRMDHTLLFRHACHHASCGSCGMRVNGRERLACLTPLAEVARPRRPLRLEPLRNLPVLGDLLVDCQPLWSRIDAVDLPLIRSATDEIGPSDKNVRALDEAPMPSGREMDSPPAEARHDDSEVLYEPTRFENCIECGLCVSACPVAGSDPLYWGPAALAAAARVVAEPRGRDAAAVLKMVDAEHGLWRCHGVFECTEVCPAEVDPAGLIMGLRQRLLSGGRE